MEFTSTQLATFAFLSSAPLLQVLVAFGSLKFLRSVSHLKAASSEPERIENTDALVGVGGPHEVAAPTGDDSPQRSAPGCRFVVVGEMQYFSADLCSTRYGLLAT
jgi:hypothetical protein